MLTCAMFIGSIARAVCVLSGKHTKRDEAVFAILIGVTLIVAPIIDLGLSFSS